MPPPAPTAQSSLPEIFPIGDADPPRAASADDLGLLARAYTLERLICVMCHEVNQPLNAISMSAFNGKRMVERDCLPLAVQQRFDGIGRSSRQAGDLVNLMASLAGNGLAGQALSARIERVADLHRGRLLRRGLVMDLSVDSALDARSPDPALVTAALVWMLEHLENPSTGGGADRKDNVVVAIGYDERACTCSLSVSAAGIASPDRSQSAGCSIVERLVSAAGGQVSREQTNFRIEIPLDHPS